MEKFYLKEAIESVLEHKEYKSEITGVSTLDDEYLDCENWLNKLEATKNVNTCPSDYMPGRQFNDCKNLKCL